MSAMLHISREFSLEIRLCSLAKVTYGSATLVLCFLVPGKAVLVDEFKEY